MLRILLVCVLMRFTSYDGLAQTQHASASIAFGSNQGSLSFLCGKDWRFGKNKKFSVGTGLRFTSFAGSNLTYETAPAKLTSGSTGPGVIFVNNINTNIDSLRLPFSQVNCLNVIINLSYHVSSKLEVGFDIDAIGFSFGSTQSGNFIHNGQITTTSSRPTAFNILLVSDNDRGSLNSEFYCIYFFNEKWGAKLAAQFLFTEYTTASDVQQFPQPNDRFRNKSLLPSLGLVRRF